MSKRDVVTESILKSLNSSRNLLEFLSDVAAHMKDKRLYNKLKEICSKLDKIIKDLGEENKNAASLDPERNPNVG